MPDLKSFVLVVACLATARIAFPAESFVLPTPNRAIYAQGKEENYFAPTPGRTWVSGTFGCVRSEGWQMHEGLDILHTTRDKRGEPLDPVFAAADGRVAYINANSGLSNYGKYVILEHRIEGIPVYTAYAHLSAFSESLSVGDQVRSGQTIGKMGRTSNTRQAISKDRAHLHFEIAMRLNERYASWHASALKGYRNDHGNWNGRNIVGIDPREVFAEQKRLGARFSLLELIRSRTELCRVLVRDAKFSWLQQYTPLVRRNAVADREGVTGYEVHLDFNGVPFLLIPKAKSEIGSGPRVELLEVNEKEHAARPCRKLVTRRNGKWSLTTNGSQLIDLLIY